MLSHYTTSNSYCYFTNVIPGWSTRRGCLMQSLIWYTPDYGKLFVFNNIVTLLWLYLTKYWVNGECIFSGYHFELGNKVYLEMPLMGFIKCKHKLICIRINIAKCLPASNWSMARPWINFPSTANERRLSAPVLTHQLAIIRVTEKGRKSTIPPIFGCYEASFRIPNLQSIVQSVLLQIELATHRVVV